MMPAFPAYLILAASVVLLFPGVRAQPQPQKSFALAGRRLTVALVAAAAVFVVLPLGVIAATPKLRDHGTKAVRLGDSLVPVSSGLGLRVAVEGSAVRLNWQARPTRTASVFYRVLRRANPDPPLCAGTRGADDCQLYIDPVATTRSASFLDRPGPGIWTYAVGIAANWLNDESLGDVYVVSRTVTVTVP